MSKLLALSLGLALSFAAAPSVQAAKPKATPKTFVLKLRTSEPRIRSGKLETVMIAKNFKLDQAAVARSKKYNKLSSSLTPALERIFKSLGRRQPSEAYFGNVKGNWVASQQTGWEVDRAKTKAALRSAIASGKSSATIVLDRREPKRSVRDWARRGILYHYGSGTSNFAGSPSFRVKNILVGAKRLEERYVEPGQEFDFNAYVGKIDKTTGFVPGFVISDGTLSKEDGGGICQVSATIFRTAYNAGLPITERHQHSHRVSYYDPVGFEATVYAPAKNFKFKNNTGKPLFIQASWNLARQTLTFDLFGEKPDRRVTVSRPIITDFKAPAKPSYTADKAVRNGVQRRIDVPAQGMTVRILRRVKMPDGKVRKDETRSVYQPWGAVYAVNPKDNRL